jgi:ApaG protein
VKEQSDPKENYYFFAYSIRIHNEGPELITLLSRHWVITDGFGQTEEVVGEGVIGQQPTLKPGDVFEYTSFCPLATPTGSMHGTYSMANAEGNRWEIEIPKFILAEPNHWN